MSAAGIAEIVTSSATLITALGALRVGTNNKAKISDVGSQVSDVHALVNDRSEKQDSRIEQLSTALTSANVEVPERPVGK